MIARGRAIWTRIRPWLEQAIGLFPPTVAGLLALAGSASVLVRYGIAQQDLVLLIVGGAGLALVGAALLLTVLAALSLAWRVRRPEGVPVEAECGFPVRSGFRVADTWLPYIDIGWEWVAPAAVVELVPDGWGRAERVILHERGEWDAIKRRFTVSDAFGLARIAFTATERRPVRALPAVGGLRHVPLSASLGAGDAFADPLGSPHGDLFDMRPYAPGDPIRRVLWKVYARTHELLVRIPERAVAPVPQTVAFLVGGGEAAAGAARVAIESGALGGDFRFAADGIAAHTDTREGALDAVVRSGGAPPDAFGAGLQPFLDGSRGMRRAMVFAPATPGPWLDRAIAACAAWSDGEGVVDVFLCADGIDRTPVRSAVSRALLAPPEAPKGPSPVRQADLDAVRRRLAGISARITIVDRHNGVIWRDP